MNQVVFADPQNREARELEARAMEQLAYQAESGVWRSCYLVGADELRNGPANNIMRGSLSKHAIKAISLPEYFDLMAVRLNGAKAEGKTLLINWDFTDTGEKYVLNLENSALTYTSGKLSATADATLKLKRSTLNNIMAGDTTFMKEIGAHSITLEGNALKMAELQGMIEVPDPMFNMVTP
jgi:alkyl sulfatase BDS1-like metallo-beta-lactamase superfamily hydrolase